METRQFSQVSSAIAKTMRDLAIVGWSIDLACLNNDYW